MAKVTITRKIQLLIDGDKEYFKHSIARLYDYNELVFRAANTAMTHMYFQKNMSEFFYLTDRAKIMFSNINKEDSSNEEYERVLTTSRQNTTYQVISEHYKGKLPSYIYASLNAQLYKTFIKQDKEYFAGNRSLSTYRRDMPMPFQINAIRDFKATENGYSFTLLDIKFKTFFGRDLSGNRMIMQRYTEGDYKLCDSSIQLDDGKIFLLAVFQFDSLKFKLNEEKIMHAELSRDFPIVLKWSTSEFRIGSREEYLHRRIAIQGMRRRQQIAARYNRNGKGRTKKMQGVERFREMEYNYIQTRQHQYTHKMIDLCLKNKCGKLKLTLIPEPKPPDDLSKKEKWEWKIENELLLRNWGYYGLKQKIAYKCNKVGIELIEEEEEEAVEEIITE